MTPRNSKMGRTFYRRLSAYCCFYSDVFGRKEAISNSPAKANLLCKLDPQLFPASITNDKLTYKVNTLTGALPSFAGQAKVFKIKLLLPIF